MNRHRAILVLLTCVIFALVSAIPLKIAYKNIRIFQNQAGLKTIVDLLKVYTVYEGQHELTLFRLGKDYDGGYVVPEISLERADVLLGYGIADDISFEEEFSNKYTKHSYGFDCGTTKINVTNPLCHFIPECVGTDKYLQSKQTSSKKITSFSQQLEQLHISDKKIFLKMDIEGAEYEAFPEILTYSQNITGIVIEIHFSLKADSINQVIKLLSSINQNFFLVHVHGNNGTGRYFTTSTSSGKIPTVLELTYVNKALTSKAHISADQSHPKPIDMPNLAKKADIVFDLTPLTT